MNTRSVRFRLTLWYSLAFFIAAAVVFSIFYLVTSQILFRQTDNSLSAHGDKVLEVLSRQDSTMHTMLEKQAFIRDFSEIPGMIVLVMDGSGNVINSTITTGPETAIVSKLFKQAESSAKTIYSNQTINNSAVRFWVSPIRNDQGEFSGVVMIAHSIDVINSSLSSLLLILIAILLASVVPAIIGGYLLAKRALEPISNMSGELKRISSESLDKRVVNPRTGDELEELAETFNNLLDRLDLAFKRERQFIGDVAHELKTPLSTLQSSVEITLSKNRSSKEYRRGFAEALIDINKISSTLKNILDLAWSDADNAAMTGEIFNLSKEVTELRDMAAKLAFAKKITVNGEIENNIFILGKRDKLGRALLNIIDNAIKYAPEQGKVTLNLSHKDGQAVVEIKDNGYGITKEDLPHIFERFYRGGKKSATFGSGLGLAIAQAAINSHRGEIKARSRIGRGTTFTITLPLATSS